LPKTTRVTKSGSRRYVTGRRSTRPDGRPLRGDLEAGRAAQPQPRACHRRNLCQSDGGGSIGRRRTARGRDPPCREGDGSRTWRVGAPRPPEACRSSSGAATSASNCNALRGATRTGDGLRRSRRRFLGSVASVSLSSSMVPSRSGASRIRLGSFAQGGAPELLEMPGCIPGAALAAAGATFGTCHRVRPAGAAAPAGTPTAGSGAARVAQAAVGARVVAVRRPSRQPQRDGSSVASCWYSHRLPSRSNGSYYVA
jgi:hypothetical protein